MKLATVLANGTSRAARIEGDAAILLHASDVGALLRAPDWRELASREAGEALPLAGLRLLPTVRPPRILCVGLNYKTHIAELGIDAPEYPTLFSKFPGALTGPRDNITLPRASTQVDWEAELGIVLGRRVRNVSEHDALDYIAGFTVVNDITMRDWQWHTSQWLPGKNFDASTPVGPWLVTPDEVNDGLDLAIGCEVDGVSMQAARTSDLLFSPAKILAYVSQFATLHPGDLISTGTPGGVGVARQPQVFLRHGQVVRAFVEGIGVCENTCV